MSASIEIEVTVRRALAAWAEEVRPSPPRPGAVRRRVAVRRRRRLTRGVGGVAVVAGFGVVASGALSSGGRETSVETAGEGGGADAAAAPEEPGVAGALGDPALVVLDAPGWVVTQLVTGPSGLPSVPVHHIGYTFENGPQTFELNFYPAGSRVPDTPTGTVSVRGFEGVVSSAGVDDVRIDWTEAGQTWEATGRQVGGAEELAALLQQVRIVDEAGFRASLPEGIGDAILAAVRSLELDLPTDVDLEGSSGYVTWLLGQPVECHVDDGTGGSTPADPVTGC